MAEILHQLIIKAPPTRVYQALTEAKGLAGWWTHYVTCEPKIGSIAQFEFQGGKLQLRMKILKLVPLRGVVWHCLAGPPEWIGTQIIFDLQAMADHTRLNFVHHGWQRNTDTFAFHNFEWAKHLMSLRAYAEKGKGYPDRQ